MQEISVAIVSAIQEGLKLIKSQKCPATVKTQVNWEAACEMLLLL